MGAKFLVTAIMSLLLTGCHSVEYQSGMVAVAPMPAKLSWGGLQAKYSHFSQIKVELLNEGKESIFLCRDYPQDRKAHLERLDETNNNWKLGENWHAACMEPGSPIEIKPGERWELIVDWQVAFPSSQKKAGFDETHFGSSGKVYPLNGKYRLSLKYAKTPSGWGAKQEAILIAKSPEFTIKWDENSRVKNGKGGC